MPSTTLRKELLEVLRTNKYVCVKFWTKKHTKRIMTCTRNEDHINTLGTVYDPCTSNPDIINVYDYRAKGWRAFRVDSVITYEIVDGYKNERKTSTRDSGYPDRRGSGSDSMRV